MQSIDAQATHFSIAKSRIGHSSEDKCQAHASSIWQTLRMIKQTLRIWHMRSIQRRELAHLDDYLLKDIGINRQQAMQEYNKPFWKP